jgi:hypothetical protein
MKGIGKILNSDLGGIIISVILGLGLAALFRKACDDNKCILIKGPDNDEITRNIYKINHDCFKYEPVFTECGK